MIKPKVKSRWSSRALIGFRKEINKRKSAKTAFNTPLNYKPNALCRFNRDIRRMRVEFEGVQIIQDTDCD